MRTPIVAGNWKMNKTVEEARSLVFSMSLKLRDIQRVDKVLCPPFPALLAVSALLQGTEIGLGAQNMHWESKGAYTGEVSPGMVAEFCNYVIIGHSERRAKFGETDETVNQKLKAAIIHNLIPIVCIGETLEEFEAGQTGEVVCRQIARGLAGIDSDKAAEIIIAYEPVWAIGTGKAASPENANAVLANHIRPEVAKIFGDQTAQKIRIQYGGSVNASNATDFFTQPDIDGALVGGASLNAEEFVEITRATAP